MYVHIIKTIISLALFLFCRCSLMLVYMHITSFVWSFASVGLLFSFDCSPSLSPLVLHMLYVNVCKNTDTSVACLLVIFFLSSLMYLLLLFELLLFSIRWMQTNVEDLVCGNEIEIECVFGSKKSIILCMHLLHSLNRKEMRSSRIFHWERRIVR